MNAALAIAAKDLRLVLRDRAALFWIAAFPLLFALFLASVLQSWSTREDVTLRVAIEDQDKTPAARDYVKRLAGMADLRISRLDLKAAREALKQGELDAVVIVRRGFGQRADWYAAGEEQLRIESDPSRRREASYLRALLLEAGIASAVETELIADPHKAVTITTTPALVRPPTPAEVVTPAAVLWGLLGCAAAFAISLAAERQRGTLRRLRSLPIGTSELIAGKALACFGACMVSALAILLAAVCVFDVQLAHPWTLFACVAALATCFTGIMALLSTLGSSERAVAGTGWATLLVLGMLGGVMAPRMILPPWLDAAGAWSPVRWGLVALEHALWRGGATQVCLSACAQLLLTGLIGGVLGTWILKRSAA